MWHVRARAPSVTFRSIAAECGEADTLLMRIVNSCGSSLTMTLTRGTITRGALSIAFARSTQPSGGTKALISRRADATAYLLFSLINDVRLCGNKDSRRLSLWHKFERSINPPHNYEEDNWRIVVKKNATMLRRLRNFILSKCPFPRMWKHIDCHWIRHPCVMLIEVRFNAASNSAWKHRDWNGALCREIY